MNRPSSEHGGRGPALLAVVLILAAILALCGKLDFSAVSGSVESSTIKRRPLAKSAVTLTDYYTDSTGLVRDPSALAKGMKAFYKKTGVQPHIYFTTSPVPDADALYHSIFTDEGHFLMIYSTTENAPAAYHAGKQAASVMDDEALRIFRSYLHRQTGNDVFQEKAYSDAYEKTAQRIMSVTKSPLQVILTLVGIALGFLILLVAFIFFCLWRSSRRREKEKSERELQELLQNPPPKFSDSELEELEEKYKDKT